MFREVAFKMYCMKPLQIQFYLNILFTYILFYLSVKI